MLFLGLISIKTNFKPNHTEVYNLGNLKTFIYCIVGSTLEWYDFALFGIFSPFLSRIFFPHKNHNAALLLTFAIFATGFVMRPLGGIVFGHIGDRYGRKKAIVLSVFLMTIGTAGIGLLPTHTNNTITLLIIFLMLRLIQGISVGGEYPGILTFITETSFFHKRLFFHLSLLCFGVVGGLLLGTTVGKLSFNIHSLHNNAWRVPFLASVFLGAIGVYLRFKALESPIFTNMQLKNQTLEFPLKQTFRQHYRTLAVIVCITSPCAAAFYYVYIYYPAYLSNTLNLKFQSSLNINTIGLLSLLVFVLLIGYMVNRRTVKNFLWFSLVGFIFLPIPTLFLVNLHPIIYALPLQILYSLFIAPTLPLLLGFIALQFPHNVRYTALALCSNFGVIVGGTTPLVGSLLTRALHSQFAPALYVSVLATIGIVVFILANKYKLLTMQPSRSPNKY
jgi:MHS family proline/betaine transporter-like MFS transporter